MRIYRTWIAVLVGLVVLVAACSSSGSNGDDSQDADPDAEEATGDDQGEEAGEPVADPSVEAADTSLGVVLVDAEGFTLYVFADDAPDTSNCADGCAEAWPPAAVDGEVVAGPGVDGSLLGTIERDDGSTQVTYESQPLYRFAGDEAPGDTNGEGVADVWFVIALDAAGGHGATGSSIEGLPYS